MSDEEESLLTEDKDHVSFFLYLRLKINFIYVVLLYKSLYILSINKFHIVCVLGTNTRRIETHEFRGSAKVEGKIRNQDI